MPKSSKTHLSGNLATIESTNYINPSVTINGSITGDVKNIRLSFENYDVSVCDMQNFSKREAKDFINALKKINQSTHQTIASILRPQPRINKVKPYDVLFKNLPPDVDYLLEIAMTGAGRIFFHMIGSECYVVSTWTKKRS